MSFSEFNPKYGEDWPLTTNEMSKLDVNQNSLIAKLELSDLLGRLYSSNVINMRQMNFISSKPDPESRTETLIDILRRRSLRDYRQTISCLHISKQSHLAVLL